MVGIGSHDKALPQQRGKVIAIEMDAADQVVASAILYEAQEAPVMISRYTTDLPRGSARFRLRQADIDRPVSRRKIALKWFSLS